MRPRHTVETAQAVPHASTWQVLPTKEGVERGFVAIEGLLAASTLVRALAAPLLLPSASGRALLLVASARAREQGAYSVEQAITT